MSDDDVVERDAIAVQYILVEDGLENIRRAWDLLETAVGSLRGDPPGV